MKNSKTSFIRLVSSVLFSLISAAFVQAYSLLQANYLQYAHRLDLAQLPLPTVLYQKYALGGYLLPLFPLAILFFKGKDQNQQALLQEICIAITLLASFVWLLGCLLAWSLPLYYPVAIIAGCF